MKRLVLLSIKHLLSLLIIVGALAGCKGAAPSPQEEATPTPYPTPIVPTKPVYTVARGEVVKKMEFTGRIAPAVEQGVFFRSGGYVGAVYVERDDMVKAGDILAELEVTDLKNQLAQAEASLALAIDNNAQQIAEAEANLRAAELYLAIAKTEDPSLQVLAAEIDLERAKTYLEDARKAHQDALARPWEPDEVRKATARGVHDAEQNLRLSEASYQQALLARQRHQYNVQLREQEVEMARLRLERLQAGLNVEEIRLSVNRLKDLLSDARLIAPFDGRVLGLSIIAGRAVEAYKPVVIIGDVTSLEVSANVQGTDMEKLKEGMPVVITIDSRPGEEMHGVIRQLPYPYGGGGRVGSSVEDQDKSTRVALDRPPQEVGLELGDLVRVTVVLERVEDALWLPPQAIRTFEGRKFVVVQDGDLQRRVDVKIGIQGEDRVEIKEGLTEGQVIVGP